MEALCLDNMKALLLPLFSSLIDLQISLLKATLLIFILVVNHKRSHTELSVFKNALGKGSEEHFKGHLGANRLHFMFKNKAKGHLPKML